MTCRDCIHYDVCPKPYYGDKICCDDVEDRCKDFKNKANFVKVVRCKDCKCCTHCYPVKEIEKEAVEGWYCGAFMKWRKPDDYCSCGERRDT